MMTLTNRPQRQKLSKEDQTIRRIEKIDLHKLAVINTPNRGRGVITKEFVKKGKILLEYQGELINFSEGKARYHAYEKMPEVGCFLLFFYYKSTKLCIDATKEDGSFGRLINHAVDGNLRTVSFFHQGQERVYFAANTDIQEGQELFYDYGERDRCMIQRYPWLTYKMRQILDLDQEEISKKNEIVASTIGEDQNDVDAEDNSIQGYRRMIEEEDSENQTKKPSDYTVEENREIIIFFTMKENIKKFHLAANLEKLSPNHRTAVSVMSRITRMAKKGWRKITDAYKVDVSIAKKLLYYYGKKNKC